LPPFIFKGRIADCSHIKIDLIPPA